MVPALPGRPACLAPRADGATSLMQLFLFPLGLKAANPSPLEAKLYVTAAEQALCCLRCGCFVPYKLQFTVQQRGDRRTGSAPTLASCLCLQQGPQPPRAPHPALKEEKPPEGEKGGVREVGHTRLFLLYLSDSSPLLKGPIPFCDSANDSFVGLQFCSRAEV